jgi:hypothetical protein
VNVGEISTKTRLRREAGVHARIREGVMRRSDEEEMSSQLDGVFEQEERRRKQSRRSREKGKGADVQVADGVFLFWT